MVTISSTGFYGLLMNIVSTCSFVIPAAIIYKNVHKMKGALISLGTGMICMTCMMMLWDYIITPIYMGVDRSVVAGMMMSVFMPFNLVKSGINAGITLLLYKPIITALRKAHLVSADGQSGKINWAYMAVPVVVLVVFVVAFLKLIHVI